jgi:hypothetical protein
MGKHKLEIEVIFDYEGYPDYYSGHDHAFEEGLVACIPFGFPITYLETVQEIIERIIDDVRRYELIRFPIVSDVELQKEIMELLSDENIIKAIMETLPEGTKLSDKFFDITPEEEEEIRKAMEEDDSPFYNGPVLIGYIHIWKVDEPSGQ